MGRAGASEFSIADLTPTKRKEIVHAIHRKRSERSLYSFVKLAWPHVDSSVAFQENWALEGLCEHLELITYGYLKRLIVNFPPRFSKTTIVSICWPLWTWTLQQPDPEDKIFTLGPQVKFLCGSYGDPLSLDNADKMRALWDSPWFRETWPELITDTQTDQKHNYGNTKGGRRRSVSIIGHLLGFGGDIVIVDDPHNTEEVESDADREHVLRGWREITTTRLNSQVNSAIVLVMQRLHTEDCAGYTMDRDAERNWVQYVIPMMHDTFRHCITVPTKSTDPNPWEDPREEEGELLCPELFPADKVKAMFKEMGPYMASGRLQQSPTPVGGEILKRDYWGLWGLKDYPIFTTVVACLDTADTEEEENDPSALTIWGVFVHKDTGRTCAMLVRAWQGWLELHKQSISRQELRDLGLDEVSVPILGKPTGLTPIRRLQILEEQGKLGLVELVNGYCEATKVDRLLIENKTKGLAVQQEMMRLYARSPFTIELIGPQSKNMAGKGDKVARAIAAQPMFADGLVWAPGDNGGFITWAEMVVKQCELFPKGKHDDLVDTTTYTINWLRAQGVLRIGEEVMLQQQDERRAFSSRFSQRLKPLYPGARAM